MESSPLTLVNPLLLHHVPSIYRCVVRPHRLSPSSSSEKPKVIQRAGKEGRGGGEAGDHNMAKIAFGSSQEVEQTDCLRAVVAEVVLTFLFVFAGVGAAMTAVKFADGSGIMGLTAVALAHALVVAVMISAGLHISGGHLNPAVTLGLLVGGNITVVRSVLYVFAQLLGSSLACLLLKYLTNGLETPVHTLAAGIGALQGVVMEVVLTFSLLFAVYGTIVDPKKGITAGLGPLLVGLVVGANILAGGPFSGASMNPARSFGPALASWNWTDHWVYWVGPLVGGALAGLVYDNFFMVRSRHAPLPVEDEAF